MSPMTRRPLGLDIALLGFFRKEPQYGYQIHQMVSDLAALGVIWNLKQSQLYSLLTKLEKEGYIWGEMEPQEAFRPPRRMYRLTEKGKKAYWKWLESPVDAPRLIRQEFMAKYYFACQEGRECAQHVLIVQRQTCQSWLVKMKGEIHAGDTFSDHIFQYRIGQIQAMIDWIDARFEDASAS